MRRASLLQSVGLSSAVIQLGDHVTSLMSANSFAVPVMFTPNITCHWETHSMELTLQKLHNSVKPILGRLSC